MKKSVDVIIPAFNAEKFIERTLKSVLFQTFAPTKIIVVDDGSTDGTFQLVENIAKTSENPILLISQKNSGPNATRNCGLKHSESEFVAFLDADDIWEKEKLEKQIEVFEKSEFQNLGLVYTSYDLVDEFEQKIKQSFLVFKLDPNLRGNVFDKMFDAMKITGSASGVLIKRECFEKVGFFDESLRGAEDWDMWLRISKEYEIDFVDEVLVHVRLHQTNAHNNQLMMAENMIKLLKKWHHILEENHVGRKELAKKSFDYFFKAVFLFKFGLAAKILRLYGELLSKEERASIFKKTGGSVHCFALISLPSYVVKQMKRVLKK
ncbi:MAG: glycosyltransferase family 2 protein [bacterium]